MTTESTQQTGTDTPTPGAQPATETTAATTPVAVTVPSVATTTTAPNANAETTPVVDPAATTTAVTDATKTKEPEGAPAEYADFEVPDEGVLNPEVAATFKATAKELNLTQAQAQALVSKLQPAMAKQQAAAVEAVSAGYLTTIASDKELGGVQAKIDENVALAKTVFDKFGTPELRAFLMESRLGNHPELVRWAYRVGKAMSDDTFVAAGKAVTHQAGDEGKAARMYGSTNAAK